jgi:hypothetical protein
MAAKNLTIASMEYGAGSSVGLTAGTTADDFYIRSVSDASQTGLFVQTTGDKTKLTFSSTDVDYSGAGVGDLDIDLSGNTYSFVGPFDGTRLMVETTTGRYIHFTLTATTSGGTGVASVAAFEM